jgi:hypothetical protein
MWAGVGVEEAPMVVLVCVGAGNDNNPPVESSIPPFVFVFVFVIAVWSGRATERANPPTMSRREDTERGGRISGCGCLVVEIMRGVMALNH